MHRYHRPARPRHHRHADRREPTGAAATGHQRHRRLDRPHQQGHRRASAQKSWAAPRARTSSSTTRELLTALDGHMVYYENEDGRICILFPYLGKVLIGSTDIRVDDPDQVRCEEDERATSCSRSPSSFPRSRSPTTRSCSASPACAPCPPARTVSPAAYRAIIFASSSRRAKIAGHALHDRRQMDDLSFVRGTGRRQRAGAPWPRTQRGHGGYGHRWRPRLPGRSRELVRVIRR